MENGRAVGAKGVGRDGTTYEVRAKRGVVVATGGYSGSPDLLRERDQEWGFADITDIPTTNTNGHTGDGHQMILEVGGTFFEKEPNFMILIVNAKDHLLESMVGNSVNGCLVDSSGRRFVYESSYAIQEPPFYAAPSAWGVHITKDGVRVDSETCQVLTKTGEPIEGLYAAGEVAGLSGINCIYYGMNVADQLSA